MRTKGRLEDGEGGQLVSNWGSSCAELLPECIPPQLNVKMKAQRKLWVHGSSQSKQGQYTIYKIFPACMGGKLR